MKKILLLITIAFIAIKGLAQAPTTGLVAYYNFQNTLNSNSASHSFTNAGTSNISYTTGKDGQGAGFNGSAALMNATMTSSITSQAKYTIAWWEFRPTSTPSNYSTSFELGETNYYRATISSGCYAPTYYPNRYEFGLLDGPAYRCLTLQEQATLAGSWVHHAVVHNGTSVSYYLNGALNINTWLLNYSGLNLATNNFTFGGGTNGGAINSAKYMNGTLDELYIYNRALTASEITLVKDATYTYTFEPSISNISSTPTPNNATINYSINANGFATTSIIKYGTSASALTNQITGGTAVGTSATPLNSTLPSLTPNTTYYFQIEATNSVGTSTSTTQSFTTPQIPTLITEYNFNNTYNNVLGNAPFTSNSGTAFTSDRNGSPNSALYINNTGTTSTILGLPYGNSARTVSVWIKMAVLNPFGFNFIYNYGNSTNYYGTYFNNSNLYHFQNGSSHFVANTTSLNTWIHYVFTYDGTVSKIYKNGALLGTNTIAFNTLNNGNLFRLGLTESGGVNYFNGTVDDLKIYNYAISDADVTSLFSNNILASENFTSQNLKATIYPNPTSDNFSIEMENEVKSVEIYSIQGHKVLTSNTKDMNVSNLSKGMYLVKIEDSNNAVSTQKLIIK
ncbi:LamG-like jellyroll fold domain-containing protein [Flavobacterium sp.]|uniref:LamG-like jellyroll fold domain-containing protein n=1 Tax=Flavobacterium sp. TaxID=239 RepID=UPI002623C231|nr:LamG-like jellyroll fold domain-containing protein [Flavobacterium sp.]